MNDLPRTKLIFQLSAHQETTTYHTKLLHAARYDALEDADKSLFKLPSDEPKPIHVLVTEATIFHPQGGGQPSDLGEMKIGQSGSAFTVLIVKASAVHNGLVLHCGHFEEAGVQVSQLIGGSVEQTVDGEKRKLFSRYHTAGHVLGSATRKLLEDKVENFDELKANHFPDAASCEFQGSIDGKYKGDVQKATDELVASDVEVRIEWWTKSDFRDHSLTRLMPTDEVWKAIAISADEHGTETEETNDEEKTRIRVVNIVGSEVYPCGGTHVPTTKGCGKVTVRKISRQKGNSRISYAVDQ